jgi:hypothetical protein
MKNCSIFENVQSIKKIKFLKISKFEKCSFFENVDSQKMLKFWSFFNKNVHILEIFAFEKIVRF